MNRLIFLLGLIVSSSDLLATERVYQADVEGMVCAYCAYSVSRDLAELPGVESDSVDVDLENGKVTFRSAEPVSEEMLMSVCEDTGFRISGLTEADASAEMNNEDDYQLVLSLTINDKNPSAFEAVLESVGAMAAENPSRMVLKAPVRHAEELLKPILMGRRQVMTLSFLPADDEAIQLQLFLAADRN